MEFDIFIKTIHSIIGNKSQPDFAIELFEAASEVDLCLTFDIAKNWLNRKNRGYIKVFNDKKFNDIRFNTFLKSKTIGSWKSLQSVFFEIKQETTESVIDCTTDNHDKFIESIEWQFKIILRIPIVVDNSYNRITLAGRTDREVLEYNPEILTKQQYVWQNNAIAYIDIDDTIELETTTDIKVYDIWVVLADLSNELLLIDRYPERIRNNIVKNRRYTYFVYEQGNNEQEELLKKEFTKYWHDIQIVYLSSLQADINYFHIPRFGYSFYFGDKHDLSFICGYEFHRFWGMNEYKTYRMHDDDAKRRANLLKLIKERQGGNC